jgi:hypothetical protein
MSDATSSSETRSDRRPSVRIWLIESLAMAAGLAALGILLRGDDPTLGGINPSPYLILPVVLGAQYGVAAGIGGALVAVLDRALVSLWAGGELPGAEALAAVSLVDFADHLRGGAVIDRPLTIALFAAGLVLGELRESIERKLERQHQIRHRLRDQIESLSREHLLLKETKSILERRLAEVADSQSTIFDEAVDLYSMDEKSIESGILRMLSKYASVEQAALYRLDNGALRLTAQLGSDSYRPSGIDADQTMIVRAALTSQRTVTVRDLTGTSDDDDGEDDGRGIIAAPLVVRRDGDDDPFGTGNPVITGVRDARVLGVVVIDAIPFVRLNEATVRLVSLITDWGAQVFHDLSAQRAVEERGLVDPILQVYRAPYMRERLADEYRRAQRYQLDLNLLAVAPTGDAASAEHREGLGLLMIAAARESCRPGEVLGVSDHDLPHALVILPMTDAAAAGRRLELIQSLWAGRVREQLGGEELPSLRTLRVSNHDEASSEEAWQRIERWVTTHG